MWRTAMLLAFLPGCGAALVIHVRAPRPAAIPARAFPVVCVAGADDAESRDVARALADHLSDGPSRVVQTDADRLLVTAATEQQPAIALLVTLTLAETIRTQMSQVPSLSCPQSPCYGYPQRTPIDVRIQVGELVVRAIDPRSASELGRARREAEESEPSPIAARLAVIDRLRATALALVDVTYELLDLELDDTDDEVARAALVRARAGDLHGARLALEARLAEPLAASVRIAVAFDRAQLLRADIASSTDPVAEETARLADAERALLAVVQEAPDARHDRALAQLRVDRAAREDVRAQEAAAEQNFGAR